jgi:hypothetical protein
MRSAGELASPSESSSEDIDKTLLFLRSEFEKTLALVCLEPFVF